MDKSSWQNITFLVNFCGGKFLAGKISWQEHNFLVGWSNKCDAPGPRDQSDRITQIPNRGKTNRGNLSGEKNYLEKKTRGKTNSGYLSGEKKLFGREKKHFLPHFPCPSVLWLGQRKALKKNQLGQGTLLPRNIQSWSDKSCLFVCLFVLMFIAPPSRFAFVHLINLLCILAISCSFVSLLL